MEQSVRSDSTRMPADQGYATLEADARRDAAVIAMLTAPASASPDLPVTDPIFAVIAENRRLFDAWSAATKLPLVGIDPAPETDAAQLAFYAHCDDVLVQTVPQTAAGCAALARYAHDFAVREGFTLDNQNEDATDHLRILDLISRSPLLTASTYPEEEALLEIGRRWPQLKAAYHGLSDRLSEIEERFPEPEQPGDLNVYPRFDLLHGFPQTKQTGERFAPYGKAQVEELRATPRVAVYLQHPGPGHRREDGGTVAVDQPGQKRAEAIVAAWDRWQAEIAAYEGEHDLPGLNAAFRAATQAYDEAARQARSLKARTPAGVLIKAQIAADLVIPTDRDAETSKAPSDCQDAMLFSLLSDVLRVGGLPGYGIRETGAQA